MMVVIPMIYFTDQGGIYENFSTIIDNYNHSGRKDHKNDAWFFLVGSIFSYI